MRILLVVASGRSSRFGGFPKAFCHLGDRTNAENTIQKAGPYFDRIYVGVNRNTYAAFANELYGAEMFSIITGQGDAHSVLKCLQYVREHETRIDTLAVCWGDAVFTDSLPFEQFLAGAGDTKAAVACAMDDNPYAWFETDEESSVVKSHFAKEEGSIARGLHDQSLFLFDPDFAWKYLNEYRESLGIPYDNDESVSDKNEMRLLHFFEFLYQSGYALAKCVEITPGKVLSFNTQEELDTIRIVFAKENDARKKQSRSY